MDKNDIIRRERRVSKNGIPYGVNICLCKNCGKEMNITGNYIDKHKGICKNCTGKDTKRYDPKETSTCKICNIEQDNTNFKNGKYLNSMCFKCRNLLRDFGINYKEYTELLEKQGSLCAICGLPETACNVKDKVSSLSVDHCHNSGIIRGLLCGKCNKALGLFNDSPELLNIAIDYLSKNKNVK